MAMFIFVGDMLVMLFMILLVVWVGFKASKGEREHHETIPLNDEWEDVKNG